MISRPALPATQACSARLLRGRPLLVLVILAVLFAASAGTSVRAGTVVVKAPVLLGGNRAVSSSSIRVDAGRMVAFPIGSVRSGSVQTLRLFVDSINHAGSLQVGLYADVRDHPGRLVSSGVLRRPVARRWNSVGLRPVRLARGSRYWLALLPSRGTLFFRDRRGKGCQHVISAGRRLPSLPARPGALRTTDGCSLSAYVSGTVDGSGAPAPVGTPAGGCFSAPGACGLPDPNYHNVGATSCPSLAHSGSIRDSTPGRTISNLNVQGSITIDAPNVTIDNVCVTTNGGGQLGSRAILLESGAKNATIEHVTVGGADQHRQSVDQAIANDSSSTASVTGVYAYNCGECLWNGPWTVSDSYVITNGMQGTGDHLEGLYMSDSTATLNHDVLLDPDHQNSAVFGDANWGSGGPCANHWTITNSLLAGGGFVIYTCGNASSVGSSTMNISNNRFARCTTGPFRYNRGTGGTACQGSTDDAIGAGADGHGYWPDGGYFGVDAWTYCPPRASQIWSANVWDDNGAPVGC